jgi:hypothetical protein
MKLSATPPKQDLRQVADALPCIKAEFVTAGNPFGDWTNLPP